MNNNEIIEHILLYGEHPSGTVVPRCRQLMPIFVAQGNAATTCVYRSAACYVVQSNLWPTVQVPYDEDDTALQTAISVARKLAGPIRGK